MVDGIPDSSIGKVSGTQGASVNRNASLQPVDLTKVLTAVNPFFATAVAFIKRDLSRRVENGSTTPSQAQAAGDLAAAKLQNGDINFGSGSNSGVAKA